MTRAAPIALPPESQTERIGTNSAEANRPFRGFFLAYILTAGSLAIGARLFGKAGFDLLVVALGWPHVLLGLAFNLNKILRGDLKSQFLFAWLVLLTLTIAVGHSQVPITTLIYLYFVFHAFRDEIFIYHERRSGYRFQGRVFDAGGRALFITVAAIAVLNKLAPINSGVRSQFYCLLSACAGTLAVLALLQMPRTVFGSRPGLRYLLPASFLILGAMTGMQFLRWHGWTAPLFFSFLVVFHYFSWYVFSLEKIAARPQAAGNPADGPTPFFTWLSQRKGFLILTLAMNVLSFAGAWSFQILHVSSKLAYAFEMKYFLYFLVLHVTTSFVPKSAIRSSNVSNRSDWLRQNGESTANEPLIPAEHLKADAARSQVAS